MVIWKFLSFRSLPWVISALITALASFMSMLGGGILNRGVVGRLHRVSHYLGVINCIDETPNFRDGSRGRVDGDR